MKKKVLRDRLIKERENASVQLKETQDANIEENAPKKRGRKKKDDVI